MKQRTLSRLTALLLTLALLLSVFPVVSLAGNASVIISAWELNDSVAASSSFPATTGTGSLTHSDADSITVSTTGQYSHAKWSTAKYWLFSSIDTTGYGKLELSLRVAGSNTGPANWLVEYSVDIGETWKQAGSYSLENTSTKVVEGVFLPEDAVCGNLCIRLRPADTASINGNTVAGTGTNKISFIRISSMPEDYETLATFRFDDAVSLPCAASTGYGYLASTVTSYPTYATAALTAENWVEDDFWLFIFNTSGCTDMKFSADVKSSGTGPRNFAVEYSVDNGINWVPVDGYALTGSDLKTKTIALPDAAQSDNLLLRLRVSDSESVNGGTVGEKGNSKINNVELTGKVGTGRVDNPSDPTYPIGFVNGGGGGGVVEDDPLPKNAIAAWQFKDPAQLPVMAQVGYGYLANSVSINPEFTGGALSVKKWQVGSYWLFIANTTGYSGMQLSAKLLGTSTAPRNYTLQYSLDNGAQWKDIQTVAVTAALTEYTFALPDAAQSDNLLLRFVVSDATAVGSTEAKPLEIGAGGAGKLNRVILTGTLTGTHTANPTSATYPADYDPSFLDPSAGNATVVGDPVAYWEFKEAANLPAAATNGWGSLSHVSSTYTIYSTEALAQTGWVAGSYWQLVANTSGLSHMTIKVRLASSATGPRNISLRYTTDLGETWIEFATLSLTTTLKYYTLEIPDAAQSQNMVLRLVAADNEAINGNVIKNGGSCKINKVTISGIIDSSTRQPNPAEVAYPADWNVTPLYDESAIYIPTYDKPIATASGDTHGERRTIARWGGNANYEGALRVFGDLVGDNDRLDGGAELTVMVKNENVTPGFSSSSTNSTNYYMGSKNPGIGSGYLIPEGVEEKDYEIDENTVWTDDYIQLKLSTAKYADLAMSMRLRVSNKGPKTLTVKYSTDGVNFQPFAGGHYDYAYVGYGYGGATYDVSGEDDITGGVIPMAVQGNYMNVSLDVPKGAENAETLYIRFYAAHEACEESSTGNYVRENASLRVDTLTLTGCPIINSAVCDYVRVNVEGSVPAGQQLTFTTPTAGATIYYSLDCGKTVLTYDPQNKPTLSTFPTLLKVWAEKSGMASSVKTYYYYTQAQVGNVKASPNGGAVVTDTPVKLTCATEGASIRYSFDNGVTWSTYRDAERPLLTAALLENGCTMMVQAQKTGYISSPVNVLNFTRRINEKYNLYFGQLHSHTNYSDGAGSCEEAFRHATQVENLDFLAVTDHSNAFDNDLQASITDGSMSSKWVSGHELADEYTTDGEFICLYGYEMTWSNGLGHMNTYNSAGFQSRTQNDFSSYSTALLNYYNALRSDVNTISQFNHPGTTFGDFQDYAYYDPEIDELITLLEVGNGEGAIGSSGYFPSYGEYTRALDLGWHIAPTNNQDNHKGNWGDSNTARNVIMADELTRNSIYDALRNRRVYATEDNDLSIYYTLDGKEMGTILTEEDVAETIDLKVELGDPTDSGNCRVEIVANGGMVVANKSASVRESVVEFTLPASYSYYFVRITQPDGDIAVTAPVWIGEVESVGVSELSADTDLPVQGETLKLTLSLFNHEESDLDITSIEFFVNGEVVHTVSLTAADLELLRANTTADYVFPFTYDGIGDMTISVQVKGTFEGAPKQYNGELQLKYLPEALITDILIDGTHDNDYVTGYNEGNTTKVATLGAEQFSRVTVVEDEITAKMLESCDLLIITAPAKRTLGTYKTAHFSDAFISRVKTYVDGGGSVILCGLADYQDSTACQTHTEMNKLLSAIGSTMRLRSDEIAETDESDKLVYALELTQYNRNSKWLAGAQNALPFSVYSACSVDLSNATATAKVKAAEALIYGNAETFSADTKTDTGYSISDGTIHTVVQKGSVIAAASQDTAAGGTIFLSGSVFLSDYDLLNDNNEAKVNAVLLRNIIEANAAQLPVSPISEMRKGDLGDVFCIEGYVTAGTDNENTTFFDTIYIQDETGGVTIYPYSEAGLALGTKLRIVGFVDAYQDDLELQVLTCKVLDAPKKVIAPNALSNKEAMDYAKHGGELLKVEGVITEVEKLGETVTQLRLRDSKGELATVFIDGYINSGTTGKNELASYCKVGHTVSAVGVCFMHPETGKTVSSCCLRVRNCDEIILLSDACNGGPGCPCRLYSDLDNNRWYHEGIDFVLNNGLMNGMGEGLFAPNGNLTRAMLVTILYRVENKPSVDGLSNPFTDVPAGKWYTEAILWAASEKIVNGMSATTFEPNTPISREQVATILYRYAGSPKVSIDMSGFRDAAQISAYAYEGMQWAVREGILNGSDGKLMPKDFATRAQIAAILQRYLTK